MRVKGRPTRCRCGGCWAPAAHRVRGLRRAGTPFVGREPSWASWRTSTGDRGEAAAEAGDGGRRPGIGKSRLVGSCGRLDDRPEWSPGARAAACPTATGSPSGALGEIVKVQAGILESDDPAAGRRQAGPAWPRWRPARPTGSG